MILRQKGTILPNFMDPKVVNMLIVQEISLVETSCLKLIGRTAHEIQKILNTIVDQCFERFPQLSKAIKTSLRKIVDQQRDETTEEIVKVLEIEKEEPYSYNERYKELYSKIYGKNGGSSSGMPSEKDLTQDLVVVTLEAYWRIFVDRFTDPFYLRLNYNLMHYFKKKIKLIIDIDFNPSGQGKYREHSK